jgi:hypothetical protein
MSITASPLHRRSTARRVLLGAAGAAALTGGVATLGLAALPLWLVPDVALLAGIDATANREGRLAPRAVPLYNALHRAAGPALLAAASPVLGRTALGVALVWASHVAVDRALGYGLRARDGRIRG